MTRGQSLFGVMLFAAALAIMFLMGIMVGSTLEQVYGACA